MHSLTSAQEIYHTKYILAINIISDNKEIFIKLAELLLTNEVINDKEINTCLGDLKDCYHVVL